MDNVTLFKKIEGKHLVISTHSVLTEQTFEAHNVHISIDGEIMWGNNNISIAWHSDPEIKEVEEGVFEISLEKEMVIITITEKNS